jgi:formamidopyrimidine-DNA glycosylase
VRSLRRAIEGSTLASVRLLHPALRRRVAPRVLRALRGATVSRVERRGKHQLVELDDGRIVHAHFRLNGDWVIGRITDPLPRFARAVLVFRNGTRVVLEDSRALSTLDVHAANAPPTLALGPEPQDSALTAARLRAALASRRAPIKTVLLDQRVIAGLGNIYAAEALWRAKIDPRASAALLGSNDVRRLLAAIRFVIRRAIGSRYGADDVARLDVYDREGRPCRRCRTPIERAVQAGRSTYFCPRCQRWSAAVNRSPRAARP